ncbi:MAG: glyoxalase [Thermoleophilaceae bacterium]|nr:glyoxalase [Thermoleophilaceae bacterium]
MAAVEEILIADRADRWSALGFSVEDGVCEIGGIALRFVEGRQGATGILDWELSGIASTELDGLDTRLAVARDLPDGRTHPNGTAAIDHVVAFSPDLDRTVRQLEQAGLDLRRIREEPTPAGALRQAFFRLEGVILEVIQQPDDRPGYDRSRPARLWGLALVCADFEALTRCAAGVIKGPRPAVQEGRQIATVTRAAELAIPLAFMSGRPGVRRE